MHLTNLTIPVRNEHAFGSRPSFWTFKVHIFSYEHFQIKATGRTKKKQNGHSTKQKVYSHFPVERKWLPLIH